MGPLSGKKVCWFGLVLFCKHKAWRIVKKRNVLYAEKLPSEVFKNGQRGLLGSQKTARLLGCKERNKKDLVSDSFFFLYPFFLARCCPSPRAHNIDDMHKTLGVVAHTLHGTQEYLPTHFSLFSFIISSRFLVQ